MTTTSASEWMPLWSLSAQPQAVDIRGRVPQWFHLAVSKVGGDVSRVGDVAIAKGFATYKRNWLLYAGDGSGNSWVDIKMKHKIYQAVIPGAKGYKDVKAPMI